MNKIQVVFIIACCFLILFIIKFSVSHSEYMCRFVLELINKKIVEQKDSEFFRTSTDRS